MTDRNDPNDPLAEIEPYQGFDSAPDRQQAPVREDPGVPSPLPPRSPLLTGLVLGLMLVVVSIALFQLLGGNDDPGTAADSTEPPTTDDTDPEGTETDETGTDETAAVDTDETATDGVAPTGDAAPYEAVGEPIPIEELTMAVDGLGSITFGQPAADAVGRLVATFGPPDEDTGVQVSTGEWGTCVGDAERIVRWGPLVGIVVVDADGAETFAGYRLDLALGGFTHQAADLATLSGLQAGASFRQLADQIYDTFDVQEGEDPEHGRIWELRSSDTGNLLLWGTLTDEDVVRGIFANDACGTF